MQIDFSSIIKKLGLLNDDIEIFYNLNFINTKIEFKKSKILVILRDHMSTDDIFLPIDQRTPLPIERLEKVANKHPDKKFFVINNCLNMHPKENNLFFISWAPEWITNPANDYRNIIPLDQKKLSGERIWISFNNNRRMNRYLSSMYLLGRKFEKFGYLSLDPTEILENNSWDSWLGWWAFNDHSIMMDVEEYFPILKSGFYKIKQKIGYVERKYVAGVSTPKDNSKNFKDYLLSMYQNALVEVINETVWFPDAGGIISEKYLNSVYGKNFPIIVSVANSVKNIRNMGFDVFDDIIDHSYDEILSPTKRLISALELNERVFFDFDYINHCWNACQERWNANIALAKTIENTAEKRLLSQLKLILQ